ncbi:MAG: hypothetical protein ACRETC_08195, partial [Gammaproteobacteria bacterium]
MHSSDAWRELGSTKGKSKKAMYKFTRPDNWEEIEDFLEQTGGTDCEEQIAKSGYNPRPDATIGTPEFGALAIEIYSSANDHRVDTPYDFLVCIEIAGVG